MKALFLFIGLALLQPLFAQKQVVVDPNAQVREIQGTFRSISVSGGIEVFLSQSNDRALAVSASREKEIDHIITVIENGELKISLKDKSVRLGKNRFRVYVSCPDLESIKVSSASDFIIAGTWKSDSLYLKVSSASDMQGEIDVQKLSVSASGASDVMLTGKAGKISMDASGASDIKCFGLTVDSGEVVASGASDIQLTVNGDLDAVASGASHIRYKGNANLLNSNTSGASRIQKGK